MKHLFFAMIILEISACRVAQKGGDAEVMGVRPKLVADDGAFPIPDGENNILDVPDQDLILAAMTQITKNDQKITMTGPDGDDHDVPIRTSSADEFEKCLAATHPAAWSDLGAHFYCLLGAGMRVCFTGGVQAVKPYTRKLSYREAFDHCAGLEQLPGEPFFGLWKSFATKEFQAVFNNLMFHTQCTYGATAQEDLLKAFYARNSFIRKLGPFSEKSIPHRGPRPEHVWEGICDPNGEVGGPIGEEIHPKCPVLRYPAHSGGGYEYKARNIMEMRNRGLSRSDCNSCGGPIAQRCMQAMP